MKRGWCVWLWLGLVGLIAWPCGAGDQDDRPKTGDTVFVAYEGPQDWPRGRSTQMLEGYAVPIYLGLPTQRYRVLGRIYDDRIAGFDVVGKAFDEAFGKEKRRFRNVANQAKLHGGDAVVVTDDAGVIQSFEVTTKELKRTAPLLDHKRAIILVIKIGG